MTRINRLPAFTALLLGALLVTLGACGDEPTFVDFESDTLRFTEISAGARHTCALSPSGRAYCWGYDGDGQLGAFRFDAPASSPLPVNSNERFLTLSAGARHTCALTGEGELFCWGTAGWGANGTPERIGTESGFVEVASTFEHACALKGNGDVACWGDGSLGQLGTGTVGPNALVPITVTGLPEIQDIAAGGSSSCGLDRTGTAWCWGLNDTGQLGAGDVAEICTDLPYEDGTQAPCALTPVQVMADGPYVDLVAGLFHACGLRADGGIDCWGDDSSSQLGVDTGVTGLCDWANGVNLGRPCTAVPLRVSSNVSFASLARGSLHTCGVADGGEGYCWGSDSFGQIGSITSEPGAGPESVTGGHVWARLTGGQVHTCGITQEGAAFCWGDNTWGQLGSMVEHTVLPVLVAPPF